MIKTVQKAIFVLSLVFFLHVSSRGVFASSKIQACMPLANTQILLPKSEKSDTSLTLYLPIQNNVFVHQSSKSVLAGATKQFVGFEAEIGESENPNSEVADDSIVPETTTNSSTPAETPIEQTPQMDGGLNINLLFDMINSQRTNYGLAPVIRDERICSVAASRGPELYNEIMVTHTMHAGFYARNLPYWASEIVIYMRNEQEAINWWMGSPVHKAQILGDYKYACGTCSGNACNMIFTNFTQKDPVPSSI